MNMISQLHYKNLIIRRLTAADLHNRVRWLNDPEINKTLVIRDEIQIDKTIEWFEKSENDPSRVDFLIESDDAKPIGVTGLRRIDQEERSGCIYIVIGNKAFWGRGVMYDVHLCLLNYSFQVLGLQKVWGDVLENNVASYITLKKIGFKRETLLEKAFSRDNKLYDIYRMCINSDEFYRKYPQPLET